MPRCKICKDKFEAKFFNQKTCFNASCVLSYKKILDAKEWKAKKRVLNEKIKTKSDYYKELQVLVNSIAREIDKGSSCMMCGNIPKKKNGCHYHSVGSNPTLRYNLFNIWLGCEKCNVWLGGNIIGYDNQLIKYYGKEKWEYIKFDLVRIYKDLHLSIEDIKHFKLIAKEILTEINNTHELNHKERWIFREKLNKRLNIYK